MASLPAWPTRGERKRPLPFPLDLSTDTTAAVPNDGQPQRRARVQQEEAEAQAEDEHDEDACLAPEMADVVAALGLLAQRLYAPASAAGGGNGGKKKQQGQRGAMAVAAAAAAAAAAGRLPPPPPPPLLPVVLQHQLYTVLDDATAADVELEALRRQGFVRLLKLLTQRQADVAVCLASAYLARIQAAVDQCGALEASKPSSSAAAAAPAPSPFGAADGEQVKEHHQRQQQDADNKVRIYALRFLQEVVGRFTSLSVTRQELESAMAAFAATHPPPSLPPSSDGAAAATAATKATKKKVDASWVDRAVRPLLKLGFLARRVDSRAEEAYWFSAPELGRVTASLPAGRKAVLAALRRSRYKELSERNVQTLDFGGTVLSPEFHVADLIGAKEVLAVDTAAGRFLRLPPGAAAASGGGGGRKKRGR